MNISTQELLSACPVEHLSYSAIRLFLEDARAFKKGYVLGDWSGKRSQTLTAGACFHAGLENYWRARQDGVKATAKAKLLELAELGVDHALERAMEETDWDKPRTIAKKDAEHYAALGCEVWEDTSGKKPSWKARITPECMKAEIMGYIRAYAENPPEHTPLLVEASHTAIIKDEETGENHLLPFKAKLDLVDDDTGEGFSVTDHKLVGEDPEKDEDGNFVVSRAMRIQATAYDSILPDLLKSIGKDPARPSRYVFEHFNKKTGEIIPVEYVVTDLDRVIWARIFRGATLQIALACALPDKVGFLPNPFHPFNDDGWREFEEDVRLHLENEEEVKEEETAW